MDTLTLALILAVVGSSITISKRQEILIDDLSTIGMIAISGALMTSIFTTNGIEVKIGAGTILLSIPLLFEIIGVSLVSSAISLIYGVKRTLIIMLFIYIVAVFVDSILFFKSIHIGYLITSAFANGIVLLSSIVTVIIINKYYYRLI